MERVGIAASFFFFSFNQLFRLSWPPDKKTELFKALAENDYLIPQPLLTTPKLLDIKYVVIVIYCKMILLKDEFSHLKGFNKQP